MDLLEGKVVAYYDVVVVVVVDHYLLMDDQRDAVVVALEDQLDVNVSMDMDNDVVMLDVKVDIVNNVHEVVDDDDDDDDVVLVVV